LICLLGEILLREFSFRTFVTTMSTIAHSLLIATLALAAHFAGAAPLSTAINYQGRLLEGGTPANGKYDLRCVIWTDASNGVVEGVITNPDVVVSEGLFTASLDFGGTLDPSFSAWLEIGVRTNGSSGDFTRLTPRQLLAPVPAALYAKEAGSVVEGSISIDQLRTLNGATAGKVLAYDSAQRALTWTNAAAAANAWALGGNPGTSPSSQFLGTTDNQALEVRVNNTRALRIEPRGGNAHSVVLGSPLNVLTAELSGGTISGGAGNILRTNSDYATLGGGYYNLVAAESAYSAIGGGKWNTAEPNSTASTIGGGESNTVGTNSDHSTIGGGRMNGIASSATNCAIGGGYLNRIYTRSDHSTISGGYLNSINSGSYCSSIGGGYNSQIGTNSYRSVIAGGYGNTLGDNGVAGVMGGGENNDIGTNSHHNTIGGGQGNAVEPSIGYATISGGAANTIGGQGGAVSGGYRNTARASYSAIGGGYQNTASGVYATVSGGLTNLAGGLGATVPGGTYNVASGAYSLAAGTCARATNSGTFVWSDGTGTTTYSTNVNSVTFRASGGYRLFTSVGSAGALLVAGSGSWTSMSDRNAKTDFAAVDAAEVLAKVTALPLSTWRYKTQDESFRHVGPMAQDFKAAFGVGETDTGISTVDADGVALAAIQGLNQKLHEELGKTRAENEALKRRLERLERLVEGSSATR
jgi:hypothetical protein